MFQDLFPVHYGLETVANMVARVSPEVGKGPMHELAKAFADFKAIAQVTAGVASLKDKAFREESEWRLLLSTAVPPLPDRRKRRNRSSHRGADSS
jgi:hypothetical protein